MEERSSSREASHAGSWYTDSGSKLDRQLTGWLAEATSSSSVAPRAIISPHAGYSYSGPTAAYCYKLIVPDKIKRVFILGPSHHYSLSDCALTRQTHYSTPLGSLVIDEEVNAELMATGLFQKMSKDVDEAEHSIEMQLPYLYKVFEGRSVKFVPIMVGSLSKQNEAKYGKLLSPYLDNEENFFVISSDFCHWGKRFSYQYYDERHGEIHESIEWLDREGMRVIETKNPELFDAYRKDYRNTICGRHPIAILLHAIKASSLQYDLRFVHYTQSSQCRTMKDSSVSYAAAVATPCSDRKRKSSEDSKDNF